MFCFVSLAHREQSYLPFYTPLNDRRLFKSDIYLTQLSRDDCPCSKRVRTCSRIILRAGRQAARGKFSLYIACLPVRQVRLKNDSWTDAK